MAPTPRDIEQLRKARAYVAEAEEKLARQRRRIAELERDGHDADLARKMLRLWERVQEIHIAEQYRLEKNLKDEKV
jgi:hypothetical protein